MRKPKIYSNYDIFHSCVIHVTFNQCMLCYHYVNSNKHPPKKKKEPPPQNKQNTHTQKKTLKT